MTTSDNKTIRKAAILVATLDRQSADALLDQMDPQQAERVRHAVIELGHIEPAEQQQVVDEFMRLGAMSPSEEHPGIELDSSLARRIAAGTDDYPRPAPKTPRPAVDAPSAEPPPFRFLHEATGQTLIPLISREHPQTIAVVLSHLAPSQAADVLAQLPEAVQADVVRRVVDLDATDPEVLRDIEQELESLLSQETHTTGRRKAGLSAAAAILAAAGKTQQRDLIAALGQRDRGLAEKLQTAGAESGKVVTRPNDESDDEDGYLASWRRRQVGWAPPTNPDAEITQPQPSSAPDNTFAAPSAKTEPTDPSHIDTATPEPIPVPFEEFSHFDDASLATVLGRAEPEVTLLALTGASGELAQRVLNQLSPDEARLLRNRMRNQGPLRLSDVERAQQNLARLAGELAAQGEIRIPAPRKLVLAA